MNVVLLATGRLPRSYFETVRADLGDDPDLAVDVIGWAPPREPVDDVVRRFVLIGPGRLPVAAPSAPAPAVPPTPAAKPQPPVTPKPAVTAHGPGPLSLRRVARAVVRRARKAARVVKKSRPVATIGKLRTDKISREYWSRARSRDDVLGMIDSADIVVALDSRSLRAAWYLARRPAGTPVVLGVAAAARKLAS